MKIALIQMNIKWENKRANLAKAAGFIGEAADAGADVAVLPEMFSTGFSMDVARLGEPEDGETASYLAGTAARHGIHVIAGVQTRAPGDRKGRNMALVFGRDGRLLARYGKVHPFSYAGEDEYFEAGGETVVFPLDGVPSSVFICYDLRFPEVFREVAVDAKLVFVIANWPSSRQDHWVSLLKARAIENQCFVAGVNRTGKDGNGVIYLGLSSIFTPSGNPVGACGSGEEMLVLEIKPGDVDRCREEFPFLRDMALRRGQ